MQPGFSFQLNASDGPARAGTLTTPHGSVPTPLFMPVATAATVKGVDIGRVADTGAGMILANAYHLHLRPGESSLERAGGLAAFMGWHGPTLTDSGGFQVFSLARQVKVNEQGAFFRSHLDGSPVEFTPEASMRIQESIGADVAMQLDHVVALPAPRDVVADAMRRSLRWAERCRAAHARPEQALFGIVQGGLEPDLRQESAEGLRAIGFPGYAVGGLSVGEGSEAMDRSLRATVPHLPADRPRYLMGVGQPRDIIEAVATGIDMFDCVLPT
ncbi:MAG: tRNA guanosine(34) transglycosylase Tgt, partial [Planctomycetia bacterium]|nr:tRNA guanosine(34) transglycosylase Tgt [Planctomycetia bacterium]